MSLETQQTIARVLVVDDEPDICELIAETLRTEGLEVMVGYSGSEALDAARRDRPDLVVADLKLGDCSGLDLVARLRDELDEDLPVVIITGHGDASVFSEASRVRPVELLNKPLDLERLRQAVLDEIHRQSTCRKMAHRQRRIRELARHVHRRRRRTVQHLTATCDDLTAACRDLQERMSRQDELIRYQSDLLAGSNEDETFSQFFRMFVHRTGPLFGVALLCDENAELQMVGRFGVPVPDGVHFCKALALSVVDRILTSPEVQVIDATDNIGMFPTFIRSMLVGVTVMPVPLMVGPGQLIGLCDRDARAADGGPGSTDRPVGAVPQGRTALHRRRPGHRPPDRPGHRRRRPAGRLSPPAGPRNL
ncbi:MAG: response regulator [Planctomycetota bacterium]|jgi:FixJ family two-component response regulator